MVQSLSPYLVFVISAIFIVKAVDFSPCTNYILTSAFYNSATVSFLSQKSDNKYVQTNPTQSDISATVSCSSTYMNGYTWSLLGDFSGCTSSSEFGFGLWVNFESTLGLEIMTFGSTYGYPFTYAAKSDIEGNLTFSFTAGSYFSKDVDDFSIQVPRSNFYLDQWTFLTFHWKSPTLDIYIPGQEGITKTAKGSYSFLNPTGGKLLFGGGMKAKIYQILGFKTALISGDKTVITLSDGTVTYAATGTCSVHCNDPFCHPTQKCIGSTSDCTTCNSSGCTACAANGILASDYCNFIACSLNCQKCSTASVCTQCEPDYFLYDNAGQITCISCATSCTSCKPGPSCFLCADSIVQDGNACRVDSVGYQVSFSHPNIEIDFAHPLVSKLTLSTISAKSNKNVAIDTTSWHLNSCPAGSSNCIIATDNVSESQLPIELDLAFSKDP